MLSWVDDISQLDYYANSPFGCFCEEVTQANDLILQGEFNPVGGVPSITLLLYSADGATEYETITTYFNVYYAKNPDNGLYIFNAQLKEFSPEMCVRKCWIIRAIVTGDGAPVFDKYTHQYCKSDCCGTPGDIDISEAGVIYNPPVDVPVNPSSQPLTSNCETYQLIRLVSKFNCYDKFSGYYYGVPPVVISGDPFPFVKVSTLKGRVVRRPKEITRELSYNCVLQRSESTAQYLLEGFDLLPAWKMAEVENQLHAPEIWVDQFPELKQYQFAGGVAFKKPSGARECDEIFKLFTFLEDCRIRQVFGCPEPCFGSTGLSGFSSFFVVPANYVDGDFIYSESREVVGSSIDDLVDWIRNQSGMTDAGLIATSPLDCDYAAVIGFSGANPPQSIYIDSVSPANRLFAVDLQTAQDVCDFTPVISCPQPVIGAVSFAPIDCDAPVFGTITVQTVVPDAVGLYPYGNWVIDAGMSAAYVFNGQVSLSLSVTNNAYAPTPGETFSLSGEVIAVMGAEGRPSIDVSLTSANSSLPDTWQIVISPTGLIQFTGDAISNELVNIEVTFSNVTYNI